MLIRTAVGRLPLPRGLWLALAVTVLPLLTLITLQVYEAVVRSPALAQDRARVTQTFDVIGAAESLRATAQDAERAQRGYLLTGAIRYLETYRARADSCRALLEQLRRLTLDNPEQQRRLPTLQVALDEWLVERQATLDTYSRDGFAAAQQLVSARAGQNTLRAVNGLIDASIATERDLLVQREARAAEDEKRVGQIATLSGALGFALLGAGVWLTVLAFHNVRDLERQRRETEQRLNEQLMQAQAALGQTQKMEALGQLTGGVAHDFNNLLHVIKNAVSIVQRRLHSDDPDLNQYLDMVKRNTDRAAATTARLLAFARQQPLDPKPTDLNKLVSGMAELLGHVLGESVSMETVLGSGLWTVSVDKNQLETALLNLAVNARDAMPSSGKLTIETSNAFLDESYARFHPDVEPGQYSMIAVSDTGIGMTKEIATRAFDPFFTTKESGRGTGLGLSQVFGFVKQSGGHVKIYSEPERGTTVKMYFPRLAESAAEQSKEIVAQEGAGSGESILVVEDNEDVRAFTAQMLGELGYRVTVAPDGKLALKVLEQLSGVDLLFTDVGLPDGMSGRDLATETLRRWPRIKVLYTTGYARNSIIHHGRLDPGVELIIKPFTQSTLAAKVRHVLHRTTT
jgi:signal transduction histidine kinase